MGKMSPNLPSAAVVIGALRVNSHEQIQWNFILAASIFLDYLKYRNKEFR